MLTIILLNDHIEQSFQSHRPGPGTEVLHQGVRHLVDLKVIINEEVCCVGL